MASVTIQIAKYDPSRDSKPAIASYEVPWKEYMTALQALHHINEYIEPIAFDYSCRGSLCGRCGIMVNGSPRLACYTVLQEGETYLLEPLKGLPVIRDLVVDKSEIMDKLMDADASVTVEAGVNLDSLPKIDYDFWWEDLQRKNMCRECGLCYTVCPVYQNGKGAYAGPGTLSQIYLRAYDQLDERDRVLQAVELGVFSCIQCGECNKVCPSYIDHLACNKALQDAASERGLKAK